MRGEGWRARFDAQVAEELSARRALAPDGTIAGEEPRVSWRSVAPAAEGAGGGGSAVPITGGLRARVLRLPVVRARQRAARDNVAPKD
jgi:hypothetical protein